MKIVYITDMDVKGSGYRNLSIPLLEALAERGHEIKVAGLGYHGEEHWYPFSIIPAQILQQIYAIVHNLKFVWNPDVMIVALDVPLQIMFMRNFEKFEIPYVGIFPVEAEPLTMSWTMAIMQMRKPFIISEFGTKEAQSAGIDATHLPIGIDPEVWRPPSDDERTAIRHSLAIEDDEFFILTVAANQERKNLSRAMDIAAGFAEKRHGVKYGLVTQEHSDVGWNLQDYALEVGIANALMVFERGMSFKELWSLYAAADAFLLTSKAEGLGMPILEAQAVGVPVVATRCTAIIDHLSDRQGYFIEPEYTGYRDPFGNSRRYFAMTKSGVTALESIEADPEEAKERIARAKEYVATRTWERAVDVLEKGLKEIVDVETTEEEVGSS